MHPVIKEILEEIKKEDGTTLFEAERVLDAQFKTLQLAIEERDLRPVNLIHLGKFKPSKWMIENYELTKRDKRYYTRVQESLNKE